MATETAGYPVLARVLLAATLCLSPFSLGCLGVSDGPTTPTPEWQVGEAWNYTTLNHRNEETGWVNWTVTAIEPVENQSQAAYRIEQARHAHGDQDHDGEPDGTQRSAFHLDVATLNKAWNVCKEVRGEAYFGACQGTRATWDFPLEHGATWETTSGGDVIIEYTHTATRHDQLTVHGRTFNDVWQLQRDRTHSGQTYTIDVYSAAVGAMVYRAWLDTNPEPEPGDPEIDQAWVLEEHHVPPTAGP